MKEATNAEARQKPSVLVVDDSVLNVKLLEAIFTKEGFRVLTANSGADGRLLARSGTPDLILLDIMMPGENGFSTCRTLKADPFTADIPVIFISALDEVDDKVRGFDAGAVDYITKPFNRAEVLARSRLHIKLREAHAALVKEQSAKLQNLREAQEAFLTRPEDRPGAGFAVCYQPFHEAGGDFYDVMEIGEGIFGYFVADVSGHDIGSSLSTSALKALFHQNASPVYTAGETMKMVNRVMAGVAPGQQFLTACYAHLNRLTCTLTLISAGHPAAVYLPANGGAEAIDISGDVIGVFKSISFDVYERPTQKGDRFFLYTDGLIERFGPTKRLFREGIEDLKKVCEATRNAPLNKAIKDIVDRMGVGAGLAADDLLLLGVEV